MTLSLFFLFSVVSVVAALLMVTARNPIHSVLYLILTFFMIAGHYVLLNAQFLAIVHIIVYAGAIMVLFLFVLMMLNLNRAAEPHKPLFWKLAAAVASGLLFLTFLGAFRAAHTLAQVNPTNPEVGLVENLGKALFTDYVVPFEIAGILFLGAMVGAVLVGKKEKNDE